MDKELTQALKEFDKTQEKILQNEIFDEAVRLERDAILRIPQGELTEVHRERLRELDSLNIQNRVETYAGKSKMSQGSNGPIYKHVITTFETLSNANIDDVLASITDPDKKDCQGCT